MSELSILFSWVFECARRGEKVAEADFLVDKVPNCKDETVSMEAPEVAGSKPGGGSDVVNQECVANEGKKCTQWLDNVIYLTLIGPKFDALCSYCACSRVFHNFTIFELGQEYFFF